MLIIIAIPAYNEELILEANVEKLRQFCLSHLQDDWQLVIADNNSTDSTAQIAKRLAGQYMNVDYLLVPQIGKGQAIRAAWMNYQADVYLFMDADLATDLSALPVLIQELKTHDLVIGSRFLKQSQVNRSWLRNLLSQGYRWLVSGYLGLPVKDLACGFKGITDAVKKQILPKIRNNTFFFDSELVILAIRAGFSCQEIPVKWHEPRNRGQSKVNIFKTIKEYIANIIRLK